MGPLEELEAAALVDGDDDIGWPGFELAEDEDDPWMQGVGHVFADALTSELNAFKRMERVRKAVKSSLVDMPCPPGVEVRKGRSTWVVWRGDRILGRAAFPIHWHPPCVSGLCMHRGHGSKCRVSVPLEGNSDQRVIEWLAQQDSYLTLEEHQAAAPK